MKLSFYVVLKIQPGVTGFIPYFAVVQMKNKAEISISIFEPVKYNPKYFLLFLIVERVSSKDVKLPLTKNKRMLNQYWFPKYESVGNKGIMIKGPINGSVMLP